MQEQKLAQLTAARDMGPYQKDAWSLGIRVSVSADEGPAARAADSLQGEEVSQDSRVKVPGESIQTWVLCLPLVRGSLDQTA